MTRRDPDAPISSVMNMYPNEQDEFFVKPGPKDQKAMPLNKRNPHAPVVDLGNMTPAEADDFLGKPDPKDQKAMPFILAAFGLIGAWAIYLFFFQ